MLIFVDEGTLRRSLFEHTGGSYPEVSGLLFPLAPRGSFAVKNASSETPRILRDTAYAEYILAYYKRRHQSISTTHRYDSEIRRRFAYAYASIGGLTVYCFGDPAKMSDENVRLALRVHDECNGSDVFGSDICTCRPYLIYGIEEAVKEAQKGGSGVVIYFRKEGRALGEVTKV